jgi:carbamoyltransferase
MGLAPYGNPSSPQVQHYINLIKANLVSVRDDGSIWLNKEFFAYATGLRMIKERRWAKLFRFKRRAPEQNLEQHHCDLALAIQVVTEDIVKKMVRHGQSYAENEEQSQHLCMAGGVALNCVANGKIREEGWFKEIYIQPAAGDAGGAIGAALAASHIYEGIPRVEERPDSMAGAYLGPDFDDKAIRKTLQRYRAPYTHITEFTDISKEVASLLAKGKIIGWFQGRMEFGPRALGNRSILADARNPDMQRRLNLKIKYRESFRPFAPAVLAEDSRLFFDLGQDSPYMLLVGKVNKIRQHKVPENYYALPPMERLYFQRSDIPAVTHIDFSARVQTVHKNTNERFWQLIDHYRGQTGYGLLINTSFNVRGEPIVCTPEDAYKCFMRTEIDYLVMDNFILAKDDQPLWQEKDWKNNLPPD